MPRVPITIGRVVCRAYCIACSSLLGWTSPRTHARVAAAPRATRGGIDDVDEGRAAVQPRGVRAAGGEGARRAGATGPGRDPCLLAGEHLLPDRLRHPRLLQLPGAGAAARGR